MLNCYERQSSFGIFFPRMLLSISVGP